MIQTRANCVVIDRMLPIEHDVWLYQMGSQMSEAKLSCPKCQGEMIRGYVVDYVGAGMFVSQWAEGIPQNSWTGNLKVPTEKSSSWMDAIHHKTISIGTFRCQSCGFLESYAREEFDAK